MTENNPEENQKLLKLGADRAIEKASKKAEPEAFRKEVGRLLACPSEVFLPFRSLDVGGV